MPGHDRVEPCGCGVEVQVRDIVNNVDEGIADLKDRRFRRAASCSGATCRVVAADCRHKGDAGEVFQDHGIANVTGMDDEVATAQPASRASGRRSPWVSEMRPTRTAALDITVILGDESR